MKIILENELEKYAWEVMIAAHYKWEKNHGDLLREQMEWYFEDIFKKESEEAIKKEVERRLRDEFEDEFFVSEDEYVENELEKNEAYHEGDLREEYREVHADIADRRKYIADEVSDSLSLMYYTFFNAPENLTVLYDGQVIQGAAKE